MAGNAGEPGRGVLSRAVAVLGAFDDDHLQLSLSELSERARLPLTTSHRLAAELVALGLLERDAAGYRIGLGAFRIGVRAPAYAAVRRLALPFMSELSAETGENVQLGVLDGDAVTYLERTVGRRSVPLVSHPGSRLPLHATGVGKAILASLPDDDVRRILSAPLARFTPHTITAPGALLREVRAIRERGFAFTKEEVSLGSFSVAQVLGAAPYAMRLAVGVTVRRIVRTPAAVASRLATCAADIDTALDPILERTAR